MPNPESGRQRMSEVVVRQARKRVEAQIVLLAYVCCVLP